MNEAARAGNTRWRLFAVLFGMAFLSYALRQNIQVAGETMMPELGLSEIQMGWIYGAFLWGYALFQLPGGILGDRYGGRLVLTVLGLLWLLTSVLTGVLPGLFPATLWWVAGSLLVIRFLTGVVHAPIFPVQAGVLADWFPVGHWGLPNALLSTGLTLGAAATQPLVAWVMVHWGWHVAFYLLVPPGLALFALWWRFARDDPADHPAVGAAELALIRAGRPPQTHALQQRGAWLPLLRNRETLLLAASYFATYYVFYVFFTWFFHYLVKERGFSILETGFLAALPWVTGAVASALGGLACDALCVRIGPRWGCRVPAIAGLFVTAVFLAAGLYAANPYLAVVLLSLCFAGTQFTEASFWQAQTYVALEHTAPATGIMNMCGNLSGMLVAPLIPWLAQSWGWVAALASGVVFALLGGVLWFFIRSDVPLGSRK